MDENVPDANIPIADMLPEGYISLGFIAVIKCLDSNGDLAIVNVRDDNLSKWEAIGMLIQANDDLRDQLRAYVDRGDE